MARWCRWRPCRRTRALVPAGRHADAGRRPVPLEVLERRSSGQRLSTASTPRDGLILAVAGFDATFSAPKSVLVWWALTEPGAFGFGAVLGEVAGVVPGRVPRRTRVEGRHPQHERPRPPAGTCLSCCWVRGGWNSCVRMRFSALYVGPSRVRKDFFRAWFTAVSSGRRKWCCGSSASANGRDGRRGAHVARCRCRRSAAAGLAGA